MLQTPPQAGSTPSAPGGFTPKGACFGATQEALGLDPAPEPHSQQWWPRCSRCDPLPAGQQGALPLAEPQREAEWRGRHGAARQDLRGGHRGEPQEAFYG